MSTTNLTLRAVTALCLLATACSSSSETIALVAADAPEALSVAAPARTAPAIDISLPATTAMSAVEQCSVAWTDIVVPLFEAVDVSPVAISTEALGDGCRSEASTGSREISVLLEPTSSDAVRDLLAARQSDTSFMGFDEREFLKTDTWASSSLIHSELDRLIENRWIILGDGDAIRIEVAVLGDAEASRDDLLAHIDVFEGTAAAYQAAGNAERLVTEQAWANSADAQAVSTALAEVIDRIASTVNLGSLATPAGADAIAFEYAFPENFAALGSAYRPTDCLVQQHSARCELHAGPSLYSFDFVQREGVWLLDDFELEADTGQ